VDGLRRDISFAHGKKGAKVIGRLPDNTTIVTLHSQMNKDTGLAVTVDPPPLRTPGGSTPFMSLSDSTLGPAATLSYVAELDPSVQYTFTVEALTDEGCFLDQAVAYPDDMTRCV
jgi:hypothetical protein